MRRETRRFPGSAVARGRLEKWVSRGTDQTRSQARQAIRAGRVMVDGAVVRVPSTLVDDSSSITLDGQPLHDTPTLVLWHKPLGVLSTLDDPWGRADLSTAAAPLLALGLHPVGRLDADTDGLLPFSSDGSITQQLLHPKHAIRKHYRARVEGTPTAELARQLSAGVRTAEGTHTAELLACRDDLVELVVTEGKHRMVRRMLANCGHPVVSLRRLAFGELTLGDLEAGSWRHPDAREQTWLQSLG